jgi:hypothetical protein
MGILTANMHLGLKKNLSNLRIKCPWIVAAVSVLALNALLLFVLIPKVSSRTNWLYNSDGKSGGGPRIQSLSGHCLDTLTGTGISGSPGRAFLDVRR